LIVLRVEGVVCFDVGRLRRPEALLLEPVLQLHRSAWTKIPQEHTLIAHLQVHVGLDLHQNHDLRPNLKNKKNVKIQLWNQHEALVEPSMLKGDQVGRDDDDDGDRGDDDATDAESSE
jgi:hypothetical protein